MAFGYGIGFGLFDMIFPIMFVMVFGLVMVSFVVIAVRGIAQWSKNNHSPKLTVDAKVVAKRMNVSHHHNSANEHHHTSTSTDYYATFEVESGDRMEFYVGGHEYGMLIEGDEGKLTFQGTRYLGFERVR